MVLRFHLVNTDAKRAQSALESHIQNVKMGGKKMHDE